MSAKSPAALLHRCCLLAAGNDNSSNVVIANSGGGGSVTEITPGTTPTYANYSGGVIASPTAIAINPK